MDEAGEEAGRIRLDRCAALRRKGDVSAIDGVTNEKQPLHTYYYNMTGQPVGIAHGGVYIEKKIMSDGSSQSKKIIK